MSKLGILKTPKRAALLLPTGGAGLIIPFKAVDSDKELVEDSELDELVRGSLEKRGYTKQQIDEMITKAEANFEYKEKVLQARRMLRKAMEQKKQGGMLRLMQRGYQNWVPSSFRPIVTKSGGQ